MIRRPVPPELAGVVAEIEPAARTDEAAVRAHLDALTKPPGSLGRLEDLAVRLARVYGDPPPPLSRRTVLLFAADHGVAARGVSAYPPEVTAQMCRNFAAGGAAINVIARAVGADVVAVDVGVDAPAGTLGILDRKVRRGTRDLADGPALTRDEALHALRVGFELASQHASATDVFVLADMGIGNTTAAAAVTVALTGVPAERAVGPGTGVAPDTVARKAGIVAAAAARTGPRDDPLAVLAEVGGLEIAALAGAVLGAARAGRAVVVDGFITGAAALAAVSMCDAARGYLVASHRSAEPGHAVQLEALGLDPLLALDLRLGEGTGGALALPLVEAAAALLREMATFASAGVSGAREGARV